MLGHALLHLAGARARGLNWASGQNQWRIGLIDFSISRSRFDEFELNFKVELCTILIQW
jgi:hypothetical protein